MLYLLYVVRLNTDINLLVEIPMPPHRLFTVAARRQAGEEMSSFLGPAPHAIFVEIAVRCLPY